MKAHPRIHYEMGIWHTSCSTKSSSHASSTLEAAPADKQQSITRNSEAWLPWVLKTTEILEFPQFLCPNELMHCSFDAFPPRSLLHTSLPVANKSCVLLEAADLIPGLVWRATPGLFGCRLLSNTKTPKISQDSCFGVYPLHGWNWIEQHQCHQCTSALSGLNIEGIWHSQRGCQRCSGHAASCQNRNSVDKAGQRAEKETEKAHHPPITITSWHIMYSNASEYQKGIWWGNGKLKSCTAYRLIHGQGPLSQPWLHCRFTEKCLSAKAYLDKSQA